MTIGGGDAVYSGDRANERTDWYYAHIPVLNLTTHSLGVESALEAARDMVTEWIGELKDSGAKIPIEGTALSAKLRCPKMPFKAIEVVAKLKRAGFVMFGKQTRTGSCAMPAED